MGPADSPPRGVRGKRIALAILALLLGVNIWTGAPLLAIWVGSKAAPESGVSMGALVLVIVVLAVTVLLLTAALGWVNATDERLSGRPAGVRRTSPWLRSMRGEREEFARERHGISPFERMLVVTVAVAVIGFEVWFFFFAGSSLPT